MRVGIRVVAADSALTAMIYGRYGDLSDVGRASATDADSSSTS